jgi:hypothetical protein
VTDETVNSAAKKIVTVARDPSTLSSLSPAVPREISYRSFRSSARMQGSHLMLLRKPSRVAEAAREYVAGDPVQLIDWKAYARTDQLILREKRDEAAARVMIAVDLAPSMQWPAGHLQAARLETVPPPKAEIALRTALYAAHAHLKRGDVVELWLRHDEHDPRPQRRLGPRSPSDIVSLFNRLHLADFAVDACVNEFFARQLPEPRRRFAADVTMWVGDCLGEADVFGFLELGKRKSLLHILSSLELDISWLQGDVAYCDEVPAAAREPDKEYLGQWLQQDARYDRGLLQWRDRLMAKVKSRGGVYVGLSDATRIALFTQELQNLGLVVP